MFSCNFIRCPVCRVKKSLEIKEILLENEVSWGLALGVINSLLLLLYNKRGIAAVKAGLSAHFDAKAARSETS